MPRLGPQTAALTASSSANLGPGLLRDSWSGCPASHCCHALCSAVSCASGPSASSNRLRVNASSSVCAQTHSATQGGGGCLCVEGGGAQLSAVTVRGSSQRLRIMEATAIACKRHNATPPSPPCPPGGGQGGRGGAQLSAATGRGSLKCLRANDSNSSCTQQAQCNSGGGGACAKLSAAKAG
jgi:hypothetical protein